ncbi:MAG: 4-phosphoerythronate dehydrogenase [Muribaculaceae bacterium]
MKILIESHIPFIKGRFEPVAEVQYLEPEEFTPEAVKSADVLIIRTRTRCNRELLQGSRVKVIGTATIGVDHIDRDYCRSQGISVLNAAGCNAPAVAQYVLATIGTYMAQQGIEHPSQLTLGIVGVGHVGSIVQRFAHECGFRVLACDPPRAIAEGEQGFATMQQLADEAHIITFHTPLTREGQHATYHMCNAALLQNLKQCRLIINSARGAVVDTPQLLEYLQANEHVKVAIDCWEGEPNISPQLLQQAFVATPHIAGYSAEGKMRGTAMIINQLNELMHWHIEPPMVDPCTPTAGAANVNLQRIVDSYNPLADTITLKTSPQTFEHQRNYYHLRHEVESSNL